MNEKEIERLTRMQRETDRKIMRNLVEWYLKDRPPVFEVRQELDRAGYSSILVIDFVRLAEVAGMFREESSC
jgi:CBS domain containing-hemolysin-like protein